MKQVSPGKTMYLLYEMKENVEQLFNSQLINHTNELEVMTRLISMESDINYLVYSMSRNLTVKDLFDYEMRIEVKEANGTE